MLQPTRVFLLLLGGLLMGYAFFNKSFAYLGFPPLFIGEMVFAAGLCSFFMGGATFYILRSRITVAILLLAAWGTFTTFPAIRPYGLDAVRNSVLWSYSGFAILVAAAVLRTNIVERSLDWYGRWLPWFLTWAPIGFLLSQTIGASLPNMPGSNVSSLHIKGGDLAVHLTGAAAFLALGLYRRFPVRTGDFVAIKEYFCWGFAALGILAVGSRVRGGLLAFLLAMMVLMLFKPVNRATKFLLPAVIVILAMIAFNISIPISAGRSVSPEQILTNIESIVAPDERRSLSTTREWRLEWWETIIDYTVFGDYFWTGKGYGVNLALEDGFFTGDPNRSPHNAFFTMLARSGVPGALLWLSVQIAIFVILIRRYFAARRMGYHALGDVNLWLVTYWLAFMVNSSFDVFLEGPQGGIWFWSIVGYIIAITLWQDELFRMSESTSPAPATAGYSVPQPGLARSQQ